MYELLFNYAVRKVATAHYGIHSPLYLQLVCRVWGMGRVWNNSMF